MDGPWDAFPVAQAPQQSGGWDAFLPAEQSKSSGWDAFPAVTRHGALPPAKIDEGSEGSQSLEQPAGDLAAVAASAPNTLTPNSRSEAPPSTTGMLPAAEAGIVHSLQSIAQAPGAVAGRAPKEEQPQPYEQPLELSDLLHPSRSGPKIAYQLASSLPQLAGGVAGGLIAGAAVPEAGPGSVLAGGAVGAGAVSAVQTLAPFYAEEMAKPGADPDKAFNAALARAGQSGAFSAASWALFGVAPFASAAKNILAQAFVAQPAAAIAETGVENLEQGKPVTQGMGSAALNAVVGTAVPLVGHAAVEAIPRAGQPAASPAFIDAMTTLKTLAAGRPVPEGGVKDAQVAAAEQQAAQPPVAENVPTPAAPGNEVAQNVAGTQAGSGQLLPANESTMPATPDGRPAARYTTVSPSQVQVDPETYQYKASGDKGVTGALSDVAQWDSRLADPITLHERLDGTLNVSDGHQRTDLANRAEAAGQQVQMPAFVYREADGWTPGEMRYMSAIKNIGQGSGTAIDAAKVLREEPPEGMAPPQLSMKPGIAYQGTQLAKLSDEAFGAVVNGVVPAAYAAEVGRQFSDPAQQMAAIRVLNRGQPANVEQARFMVQDIANSGFMKAQADAQGKFPWEQTELETLVPERAKVLNQALQNLRGTKAVFGAAVRGEDALAAAGNTLDTEANVKGRTENDQLIDTLQRNAHAVGPVSDALTAAARAAAADPRNIKGATAGFLEHARQLVRDGQAESLQPGAGADRDGAEIAGEAPVERQAGLLSERTPSATGESTPADHPQFQHLAEAVMRHTGLPKSVGLRLFERLNGGGADGSYAAGLIKFALDTPPEEVPAKLFHEIVHAMRDPAFGLLKPGERQALDQAARKWLGQGDNRAAVEARYGTDAAVVHEEAIARLAEQAVTRAMSQPPYITRLARRMVNFVQGLGRALRGQGFKSADAVFESMMRGERAPVEARGISSTETLESKRPLITDKAGLEREGQGALFGRSAQQAQEARDAQGNLKASVAQKPMDEGLFSSEAKQPSLFSMRDDRPPAERERSVDQLYLDLARPGIGHNGGPALEPILAIARNAQEVLSPTSRPGAKPTEWLIRRHAAEQAVSLARAAADLSDLRDAINRLPEDEQFKITDRAELGERQATPELQAIADMIRSTYDGWAAKIQSLGKGYLENTIENYMGHIYGNYAEWKKGLPPDPNADPMVGAIAGALSKSPVRGSGAFLKQRTFATQREAMDAGLIPISSNPIDIAMIKLREMQKMYHGTRMIDDMHAKNIAAWVPVGQEGEARSAGLVKLDDQGFQPTVTDKGGRTTYGSYWAPEAAARIFNNYTSKGFGGSPIYQAIRASGNALNQLQLGLSGFHFTFVSMDTGSSRLALAIQQASRVPGDIVRGQGRAALSDLGKSAGNALMSLPPVTPVTAALTVARGARLRKAMLYPESATPEMQKYADMALTAGARVGQQQVYRSDSHGSLVRDYKDFFNGHAIREIASTVRNDVRDLGGWSIISVPYHVAMRGLETTMQPLMEYYVPRAKLGVLSDLMHDWAQRNPDATPEATADAMTKFSDSVDNRMGQMVYDNLFWKRNLKDLAMITTRSVGWNLGSAREIGGGAVDTLAQVARIAQRKPSEVTTRMAYTVGMTVNTALWGAMVGYLWTGQGPQELEDYFYPKDSQGVRHVLPGYVKDLVALYHDWRGTLANKTHPLLSAGSQIYANRDYMGNVIYDPKTDKVFDAYLNYVIHEATPISMQPKASNGGPEPTEWERVATAMGMNPAPAWINNPGRQEAFQARQEMKDLRHRARVEPNRIQTPAWVP